MQDEALEAEYCEYRSDLQTRMQTTGETLITAFFDRYAALASENGDCPDLEPCQIERGGVADTAQRAC
jgi:hypothetical protein